MRALRLEEKKVRRHLFKYNYISQWSEKEGKFFSKHKHKEEGRFPQSVQCAADRLDSSQASQIIFSADLDIVRQIDVQVVVQGRHGGFRYQV